MDAQSIFNHLTAIYRPYTKLFQPVFEEFDIYPAQWLVLKDISQNAPTTLVQISKRRAIEKPTTRKILKALSEKSLLKIEQGKDKREKLLSFSEEGQKHFDAINQRVSEVQTQIIKNTDLTEDELNQTIEIVQKIHAQITKMEEL